jgi:hypothetical protein
VALRFACLLARQRRPAAAGRERLVLDRLPLRMSYRFDSFRCGNRPKDWPAAERAAFSKAFKLASLITVIFWFSPSVSAWPQNVCKSCSEQVGLVTSTFIVLGLFVVVGWPVYAL